MPSLGADRNEPTRVDGALAPVDTVHTPNRRRGDNMTMFSWGRGEDGQLGLGDTNDRACPVLVEPLRARGGVKHIACGSGHTVILTDDGLVLTWGRGDDGRLGHGDNGWKYVPRVVEALPPCVQATCGSYHTAAVTVDGELYTWGGGMYGKLGHGNESGHSTPCCVDALAGKPVSQIACGSRHTAVLLASGEVHTWGDKENGVVGHGDVEGHQYLPQALDALRGRPVRQVAACGFHTAALTEAGEIFTWGEGKFGRLGHGSERNELVPRMIEALAGKRMRQVACGGFHSAAITEAGDVHTWGGGEHGQLGHGDKVNKHAPCRVEALQDECVLQVTCGWSHTVALSEDARVYTWGNGDHGKLGHGDTLKVTTPRLVDALREQRVCRVASYNEHTAALCDPGAAPGSAAAAAAASSFASDVRTLVDNADFSDVAFIVEGTRVHAHRALLAVRCEHFRAMFSSGMRESTERQVDIVDIRLPVFMKLLEYLYSDVADVGPELAIELYVAADRYTLDRLKGLCEERLMRGISPENAASLLQLADELNVLRLREICVGYIVRHFDTIAKSPSFQTLSKTQILLVITNR